MMSLCFESLSELLPLKIESMRPLPTGLEITRVAKADDLFACDPLRRPQIDCDRIGQVRAGDRTSERRRNEAFFSFSFRGNVTQCRVVKAAVDCQNCVSLPLCVRVAGWKTVDFQSSALCRYFRGKIALPTRSISASTGEAATAIGWRDCAAARIEK
jgi:hypothetical protein